MKRTFCVIIGLLNWCINGQHIQSPCPGTFDYESDGSSVYGLIRLKPNGAVSTVNLSIKLTVATQLTTNYAGRIEPIGGDNAIFQYNRGNDLNYRVHFPVSSPLPRLTALVVNGNTICYGPGDEPRPGQYVSTIDLINVLYVKNGFINNNNDYNQYAPVQQNSDPVKPAGGDYGNDGFTYNEIDRGNDFYQTTRPNDTQPYFVQQTKPTQPIYPQQPDYGYYAEQTTPPPRTQYHQPPVQTTPQYVPPPRVSDTQDRASEFAGDSNSVQCGTVVGGNEPVPLIFKGQAYSRGEWPWLVAIFRKKENSLTFNCAGTLVSERHVITAAHCMQRKNFRTSVKDVVAKVGAYDLQDWGDEISVIRTVAAAYIHESYNPGTTENDILIITLAKAVTFNKYIRPVCLWSGNTDLTSVVGGAGVVAGWGASEDLLPGEGLPRMVRISIVSTDTCRASNPRFHPVTNANTLCAGDRKGSGPCAGDSGGGLYILDNGSWKLRGIVSLSLPNERDGDLCNLNQYIIFTDTAQFLPWIKNIMSQRVYD